MEIMAMINPAQIREIIVKPTASPASTLDL